MRKAAEESKAKMRCESKCIVHFNKIEINLSCPKCTFGIFEILTSAAAHHDLLLHAVLLQYVQMFIFGSLCYIYYIAFY